MKLMLVYVNWLMHGVLGRVILSCGYPPKLNFSYLRVCEMQLELCVGPVISLSPF